jgi:PAS domain S-box-containing protein
VRGYVWSSKFGWMTDAFIPSAVVDAPLMALWRLLALITLAVMSIVVPTTYYLSRQITEPIADAVVAAQRLGLGESVHTTPSRMSEANELSHALMRASRDLQAREKELKENEARFRSVFEQSAVGFEQVGLDGKLVGINNRLCHLLGYTREECLEKTFKTLSHSDDWTAEDELIADVLSGTRPHYELEKRMITKSGEHIWVRVTSALVRDPEGKPLYRTSVIEDVTERRKAREASARLAAIVQASPDAMISTCLAGNIETWNPGAEKLFGYSPTEIVGRPLSLLAPADRLKEVEAKLATVLRGDTVHLETTRLHKDGTQIDVSLYTTPIVTNGRITSVSETMEDIRERKRREEHIVLLNRELAHRVKNTLAVIQSIANQTMRSTPDPKAFRVAFQGRLQALASANDLLMQTNWDGSELKDFIDRQLAPLMPRSAMQLRKDGPPVIIPAELSVHLGLALHELGTNAIKHGAWSVPGGQVRLSWEVRYTADTHLRRLILTWAESNGPRLAPPTRTGFGTTLIDRGIPDAHVDRDYLPSGLVCRIDVALPPSKPVYAG